MVRNVFHLVFALTIAAVVLIVTGLIGYDPPARLSLGAPAFGGTWSDHILFRQVGLGIVFLVVAGIVALRINRRLAQNPKPSN
jgi:hypothetical protein